MNRFRAHLVFWLCLGCCLAPLLVHYDRSGPVRIMENLSIMSSQETWLRAEAGERGAWLLPTWNGRPRVNKPPMLVWMNLLAWHGLTLENSTVDMLVGRARLVAAGLSLLTLLATYAIGRMLSGRELGLLAMLVTGSFFLFVRQGRMATYDTHMLGWSTAAVAAGLWAIQPGTPPRRCLIAWVGCGLLTAAALLTKGPLAAFFIYAPLMLGMLLMKGPRSRRLAGVLLAGAIGFGLFASWYLHILLRHPYAWDFVMREYYFPSEAEAKPFWYYAGLLALVFPWSAHLLPALMTPLSRRASRPLKGRHLLPWAWCLLMLVVMSIPHAKNQRYIVPILPATGLMLAFHLALYARRDMKQRGWARLLNRLHWMLLATFTLAVPLVLLTQPLFGREGRFEIKGVPHLPGIPASFSLLLGMVLIALFHAARQREKSGHGLAAARLTALLVLVALTPAYRAYALSERGGHYDHREEAETLAHLAGQHPLYYLSRIPDPERIIPHLLATEDDPSRGNHDRDPDKDFLIYYRGIIPPITASEAQQKMSRQRPFLLCIRENLLYYVDFDTMPLEKIFTFEDGSGTGVWTVYKYLPPTGSGNLPHRE